MNSSVARTELFSCTLRKNLEKNLSSIDFKIGVTLKRNSLLPEYRFKLGRGGGEVGGWWWGAVGVWCVCVFVGWGGGRRWGGADGVLLLRERV